MKVWNKDQIIEKLKKEGLSFSEFSLVHEGNYAVDDADWNYKDVPHFQHVHKQAESFITTIGDEFITTINIQKLFGLKLPMGVVNYVSGNNEQTYYTTWLFFVLIVHTHYEPIEPNKTRVVTQYNIGSPKLLHWLTPIIRFIIKRNYQYLMSGDIPMRERRGQLRDWGYSFYKETEAYSFPKTMEILNNNVIAPNQKYLKEMSISLEEILSQKGDFFYGRDDHLGFRLVKEGHFLQLFPRMCPHEGASLDQSPCINKKLKCPWHGRLHSSLANFDLNSFEKQVIESDHFIFTFYKNQLTFREKTNITEELLCNPS